MNQHEPDTEAEEEPDIELTDPDDYHRRQRLKEIHKARQRVHKVVDNFDRAEYLKEGKKQRRDLAYAVSMYVSELEPLIHDLDADVSLPNRYPWDTALEYADSLGHVPDDYERTQCNYSPRRNSIEVFRICNSVLADVKPLITDDDSNEWEV